MIHYAKQVTIVKSKKKITLLDSDDEAPNGTSDQKRPVLKDSSDSDGEVTKNSKKSNAAFAESNSDSDNSLNESRSKSVKKFSEKIMSKKYTAVIATFSVKSYA